jgi:2'-5' RNA ligase
VRTFVAVVPPPEALAPLVAAVDRLRATYAASWVPPQRLHVTLAFLGEVAEEAAARVAEALRESVADVPPFRLQVLGGGAFPRERRARVLWAGLDGDLEALNGLVAAVSRSVEREAGVEPERREFVPHVTVARLRQPADVTGAVESLMVAGDPWVVGEVVLMRSVLGPAPSYEPLARIPLR